MLEYFISDSLLRAILFLQFDIFLSSSSSNNRSVSYCLFACAKFCTATLLLTCTFQIVSVLFCCWFARLMFGCSFGTSKNSLVINLVSTVRRVSGPNAMAVIKTYCGRESFTPLCLFQRFKIGLIFVFLQPVFKFILTKFLPLHFSFNFWLLVILVLLISNLTGFATDYTIRNIYLYTKSIWWKNNSKKKYTCLIVVNAKNFQTYVVFCLLYSET